jgi:hypothetical protein
MQPTAALETPICADMTIRSTPRCVIWLIFTSVILAIAIAITQARSASAPMFWLFALYGVQGLIAETLGVKTDQTSLTIPRRLSLILLVFWRERISWMDIVDITSIPETQRIKLRKVSGGDMQLTFPNRDKKLRFLEIANQMGPSISIYRGH